LAVLDLDRRLDYMGEMTNKDVLNDMLRKTFPNVIFIRSINEENKTRAIHFSKEWLDEEYKADREDK
jgi:hypothetical protein